MMKQAPDLPQTGWIKLHRDFKRWRWYPDHKVTRLFLHLLITVNYKPSQWLDTVISPGERVTSLQHLSEETGLSVKEVRIALRKLNSTGDIIYKPTNKYSHITIPNCYLYQGADSTTAEQTDGNLWADSGQTEDKQRATIKEYKETKKEKNERNNIYISAPLCENQGNIPATEQKQIYGQYNNILLTDSEVKKLKERFGASYKQKIDALSEGIELKGYRYTSHYLALLKWFKDRPREEDDLILMNMNVVPVFRKAEQ